MNFFKMPYRTVRLTRKRMPNVNGVIRVLVGNESRRFKVMKLQKNRVGIVYAVGELI